MPNKKKRAAMKGGAEDEADEFLDGKATCSSEEEEAKPPVLPPPLPTLVSLAVTGATADGVGWWAVVSAVGGVNVIATTSPANNNGEWAQIAWSGAGRTQNPPNTRLVGLRSAQSNLQVTAQLNGAPQSVTIDIYDLTAIACNLRIPLGANRWKDYAGYVAGGAATMTATTDRAQAWNKLVWTPAGVAGAALNQQDYAIAAAGDIRVKVALGGKEIPALLHICQWPVLAVDAITFSGGHTVNDDTVADFDNRWSSGRAVATLDPSPLCYTRNTTVTLTATLRVVTAPTEAEKVKVRGTMVAGAATIVWTSADITVNPAAATVSFPAPVAGSAALPNQVAAYNPVTIAWEMSDPNGNWIAIGNTQHTIYVTLGNPAGTPAYWTLLHYSCTGAAGATTDQQLITGAFNPLRGRNLTRKHAPNVPLTYWNPQGPAGGNWNTALLLAEPTGAGHCGSWAEFLIDMFKVHGVATGHKVNVTRAAVVQQIGPPVVVLGAGVKRGFLVAAWTFTTPPPTSAANLTHTQGTDCNTGVYAQGQNNPTPPPAFYNHFVVYCTTDARIYDPSYGNVFAGPAAWEPASISGLFSDGAPPDAGYSPVGGTRLLQFYDMVTSTNLP
jgi:hypothetical protein